MSYINDILNVVKLSFCPSVNVNVIVCLTGPRWSLVVCLCFSACLNYSKDVLLHYLCVKGWSLATPPPHPPHTHTSAALHFTHYFFSEFLPCFPPFSLSNTTKLKHRQTDRLTGESGTLLHHHSVSLLCRFLSKCCHFKSQIAQ